MTTPQDLLIVTLDMPSTRSVERGDLSLALAGAETIDLLGAGVVTLDGDRLVPGGQPPPGDPLLAEAAASLDRREPYESVDDWLWRRGRDLAAGYLAALEAGGRLVRQERRRWVFLTSSSMTLVDSPARRRAKNRWNADEPVLAALAVVVGIRDKRTDDSPDVTDEAVATVLDAVDEAVGELAGERQRRARRLTEAAETNVRRGY